METPAPQASPVPDGWKAFSDIGNDGGSITTRPRLVVPPESDSPVPPSLPFLAQADIDAILIENKLTPGAWTIVSYRRSSWQTFGGDWLEAFKLAVLPVLPGLRFGVDMPNLDDIDLAVARIARTAPPLPPPGGRADLTLVGVLADTQIGKVDSRGGIEEFLARIDASLENFREQIRIHRPAEIILLDAGDSIENFESVASQDRTNDLSLTEQIRVWRRVFWKWIETAAAGAPVVHVASVPSNHGRVRRGKGNMGAPNDDYGIEALAQLADMAAVNPDKYGHVQFYTPSKFQESLVIQAVGGKRIGLVHGHQAKGAAGLHTWWSGQSHGHGPVASAHILVAGHWHNFNVSTSGDDRWLFIAPTSDSGSSWFTNISGHDGAPGVLSFTVDSSGWGGLALC